MYSVSVITHFSSAHNLRGYKGKCESLHGHNWKVEAEARSRTLDKTGMVMDFHLLKDQLRGVLDGLDHKYLNSLPPFKETNPTSENIARYIFTQLKKKVPGLSSVVVWENDFCRAKYEG
ncbi:MAG: 6-carboxytetrahydropterin synthase QueD [Deltaproteobacteria bacterium]